MGSDLACASCSETCAIISVDREVNLHFFLYSLRRAVSAPKCLKRRNSAYINYLFVSSLKIQGILVHLGLAPSSDLHLAVQLVQISLSREHFTFSLK